MGAEAEPDRIRLVCVGGDELPTPHHVRKWMDTIPIEGIEIETEFDVNLTSALDRLEEGGADLLAISALSWYRSKGAPDTMVAAALPRRDENHILVADDRVNFLPHKAIILADTKLQRRQLRRFRSDFRVLKPSAFADLFGQKPPPEGKLDLQSWMEDLRAAKIIGGYVTERHLFDLAKIDGRRHKLMTDAKDGFLRFLPSPLQGLTLLISRQGFPTRLSEKIGDKEALTSWSCESIILSEIIPDFENCIGLIVRHRQIPSLLNQADEQRDLLRSTSLVDPEGEVVSNYEAQAIKSWEWDFHSGWYVSEFHMREMLTPMVETIIEILGKTGKKTFSLERLNWKDKDTVHARIIAKEWNEMLALVKMDNEEDIRLGPARPPFLDL